MTDFKIITQMPIAKEKHFAHRIATKNSAAKYFSIQKALAALLCWLAMLSTPAFAAFDASVDRSNIAIHETFELTLRSDADSSSSPDLKALEKNFDILGTRQSRQVRIINGHTESWRDWVVTLSPKKTGSLTIPPISLGNEQSTAIAVNVQDSRSQTGSTASISPVFMRAELDHEQVYVQQQIILTLKIFHSVNLYEDSRLTPLDIEDAIVNQMGETRKYETVIEGTRYGVFELNFVISPQKAGDLTIPSLSFSGTMVDRRDPFGGVFSMGGGKPIVARSPEILVSVEEPPANYTGHNWLPARNITLTESWSQPVDSIKVGDAVTRTITMEAEGLNAAQLPPLHIPSPAGVNTYPDQSSTDDSATAKGIIGKRVSAIAMVPTEAGTIELPPVRLTWFDTQQKTTRVAEIPATTLKVLPADNYELIQPVKTTSVQEEQAPEAPVTTTIDVAAEPAESSPWKWIAAAFGGLWLLTVLGLLVFWKRSKKQKHHSSSEPVTDKSSTTPLNAADEASAFRSLQNACINGNKPEMILEHMKQWCRLFLKDPDLRTAQQCADRLESEQLKMLCAEIDASIYSGQPIKTTGEEILSVCSVLRKTYKRSSHKIADLYPNN